MNLVYESYHNLIRVFVDTKEKESITFTGPIFGLELEGLDFTKYPLIISPIELSIGIRFSS
jgi:hypothetical protein